MATVASPRGSKARRALGTGRERASAADGSLGALEDLLAPLGTEQFLRESWEQAPLLIRRHDVGHYSKLFSAADVDALISLTRPYTDIVVVRSKDGVRTSLKVERDSSGAVNVYWLYGVYHRGYTIIVNGLEYRWTPIRDLCRRLEAEMGHRVGANLYFTPPRARGFLPHSDDHDVFILQLDGMKRWHLFGSPSQLPLPESNPIPEAESLGAPQTRIVKQGDLLYIPRGVVHEAVTSETASIHLTVGIHVTRWIDVIVDAMRLMAAEDVGWRKALPIGQSDVVAMGAHLEGLLGSVPTRVICVRAMRERGNRFLAQGGPLPDGHFRSLDFLDAIGLDTRLARRRGMPSSVSVENGKAVIRFPGNSVSGPATIESALRFISDADSFHIHQMPDELSDESKIVLASRMVREGLFCFP